MNQASCGSLASFIPYLIVYLSKMAATCKVPRSWCNYIELVFMHVYKHRCIITQSISLEGPIYSNKDAHAKNKDIAFPKEGQSEARV